MNIPTLTKIGFRIAFTGFALFFIGWLPLPFIWHMHWNDIYAVLVAFAGVCLIVIGIFLGGYAFIVEDF